MIVLNASDAYKLIGRDKYSEDIKYMCQQTYKFWYDNYYKFQLDKYPNWEVLYDIYMNLAQGKETYGYIKGFVTIEDDKIIGYCSMNYNNFISNNKNTGKNYTLWLSDVYVWENYRNHGIASRLLDKVNETAKQMDMQIYLACDDSLIKFYYKKGWTLLNSVDKLYDIWNIMTYNDHND
jgi:GNAT superfamily N-acetyltransferase